MFREYFHRLLDALITGLNVANLIRILLLQCFDDNKNILITFSVNTAVL